MKITNPVYQTPLFVSVAPYVNSIPPEILALELAKTHIKNNPVNFESKDISVALTWETSLQGGEFWSNINREQSYNKRHGDIVSDIEQLISEHLEG